MFKSKSNKSLILKLFIVAIAFEIILFITGDRMHFPDELKDSYTCSDVRDMRAWYGSLNQILWIWLIYIPLSIFHFRPLTSKREMATSATVSITLSYILIIAAAIISEEINNAQFNNGGYSPLDYELPDFKVDKFKFECYDIADSSNMIAVLIGWIIAIIYYGWCKLAWYEYHLRITKLIDINFRFDWINKIVVFLSVIIPIVVVIKMLI